MTKKKIAIFISGRGSNMEAIIKNTQNGILKDCCKIILVFSNKKEVQGLELAKKNRIHTECIISKNNPEFEKELLLLLEKYPIDYIILAGFMKVLSKPIIEKYKNKIINIHPADTKVYKGPSGYEWAFKNKLKKTKITIHYVDQGIDTGKIIDIREVDFADAKTLEEIKKRGLLIEHKFYSEVIRKLCLEVV